MSLKKKLTQYNSENIKKMR